MNANCSLNQPWFGSSKIFEYGSELPRHESGTGPVFAIQPSYCFRKTGPSAGMPRTAAVLALSWPRVPHPPQISARQTIAPKRKRDVLIRTSWTVHKMVVSRIFPSSPRRGGCAIKKTSRSILSSRRRGGVQPQQNSAEFGHHPVRSIKEASRYFVEVASTLLGEEGKIEQLSFRQQPR